MTSSLIRLPVCKLLASWRYDSMTYVYKERWRFREGCFESYSVQRKQTGSNSTLPVSLDEIFKDKVLIRGGSASLSRAAAKAATFKTPAVLWVVLWVISQTCFRWGRQRFVKARKSRWDSNLRCNPMPKPWNCRYNFYREERTLRKEMPPDLLCSEKKLHCIVACLLCVFWTHKRNRTIKYDYKPSSDRWGNALDESIGWLLADSGPNWEQTWTNR